MGNEERIGQSITESLNTTHTEAGILPKRRYNFKLGINGAHLCEEEATVFFLFISYFFGLIFAVDYKCCKEFDEGIQPDAPDVA